MANARDVYNVDANKAGLSDPQNKQFDLSFPYLSSTHVSITVNGTATTAFTFATSTRIQLNTGPTAGDVVVIKRATSPNTRLVDYQTGSVLSDEILDKDSLQAFYLAQEANDVADIVLSKNASNLFDAGNERITNVANPTGAQDVATKNYLESTWLSASDKTQLNALNTTNLNTVAGAVSNVNTVAGAITNVNTVAGKNTQIGLLGTSDAVNDMNVLGTAGIVQDLNLLGTTANVSAMGNLGTSTNVTNMATLGASGVVGNIATVAGVASTMSAAATNATNAASSASAASGSASAAANSAAAAAASFDTFDDRYLGSKSSEPSVDNDGNALVSGALFFDSSAGSMKVYDGGNWILATSAGAASLLDYEYTATAGQTTFTGSDNNSATLSYTAGNLIVTLNGIVLDNGSDYTASSGTSIVLASGAALNDHLAVVAFKSFTVADTVPASTGGTFAGNVNVTGNIAVTGTVDGRDVATDGTKLDGVAAGATAYVHPTTAGNKHVPTGGAADQVLKYASSGTAQWGTIATGTSLPTIPNWSNPTNTYTTSGTWSKGSLADNAEVWFYLLGGGGGGSGGPYNNHYTNGGEGGRAILINSTAATFNNATYVVGAGKAGHNNVTANFVGNHSTLTLADGRVFDGSVVGASAILQSSTSTYFQVTVSDAVSLVIKTGVADANRAFSSGRYPHQGTYNSIFGGGAGRSSTYASGSTGAGGTSVYAGAGGYGTGGGHGASNTGTPTVGTYPGGGGGSQNAFYSGTAIGMAGANGNIRVYHV